MKTRARARAKAHAQEVAPAESCGLLVVIKGRERYWPCQNIATEEDHFLMDPVDYAAADDAGEIVAVIHSHPNCHPVASMADRAAMEATRLPWHIYGVVTDTWASYEPEGWKPPLVGREWCYGTLDCYALARDWYGENMGLRLNDYVRDGEWWNKGANTFVDNFAREGFAAVDPESEPQWGDALLMQLQSPVPSHVAIYVGDDLILHHLRGRLSSRDVLSGYYQKNTTHILRYIGGNEKNSAAR